MMALPPFASFPPAIIRSEVPPEEWQGCLESWVLLAKSNLLLSSEEFSLQITKDPSIVQFLLSYIGENAASNENSTNASESAKRLRRESFLLLHRILMEVKPVPTALLEWASLGDFAIIYQTSKSLMELLESVWDREDLENNSSMQKSKAYITHLIEKDVDKGTPKETSDLELALRRTACLLKVCYQYGQFLMLGSDFLDSLSIAYENASYYFQTRAETIGCLCLSSLLDSRRPKFSTLIDHVYELYKASHHDSLCKGIFSNTPLLSRMREQLQGPEKERAKRLMADLSGFESAKKKTVWRSMDKGKGRAEDEYGPGDLENMHAHKLSLVTQIQDLFPDLGTGFVVRLLDEYDEDVEQVTAHLLDDSLPLHLKQLDQSEEFNLNHTTPQDSYYNQDIPPLPVRRNVFDNDAFDRRTIDPSLVRRGRVNPSQTADNLLSAPPSSKAKAAILSALAAIDANDDERDDTYDVEDVGGTVDTAMYGSDERDTDLRDGNEEALLAAYKQDPDAFNRNADTRRGKSRLTLKNETGMTDEAIEGWAIMIARDPRRLRRLEAKFPIMDAGMSQRELAPTSWRDSATATEDDSGSEDGGGGSGNARGGGGGSGGGNGGGGRGRGDVGRGGGGRGRGKERGGRANHSRRNQRAKKMARGGFPG